MKMTVDVAAKGAGKGDAGKVHNTQGAEEEEQHVPKCDANSLPDRRGGGENLDFPDGE